MSALGDLAQAVRVHDRLLKARDDLRLVMGEERYLAVVMPLAEGLAKAAKARGERPIALVIATAKENKDEPLNVLAILSAGVEILEREEWERTTP